MTDNLDSDTGRHSGLDRRRFLETLAVSSLVGAGFAGRTAAAGLRGTPDQPLVAEQGDQQWDIAPLSTGEPVEDFYNWGGQGDQTARTTLGIEQSEVSNVFLFDDPTALSLGVLHDTPDDGSDGRTTIDFDGLPVGESGGTIYTDGFDSLDGWTTSTTSNADATIDDGRLRLRVYRCNTAEAVHDLGTQSGRLSVSFDWESAADQWYEVPDWRLEDADGNPIDYEVVAGTDVNAVGEPGGQQSASVTVEADVDGPVSIRFVLVPSDHCSNFDHADTYFWVDNLEVATVGTGGQWVVQDDPEDFDGDEPTRDTDVEWNWLARNTDGGAFRGGLDGEFAVTLAPTFHSGIDEWHLLRPGDGETVESIIPFHLENDYSSEERTSDWQTVSTDLSAYAGEQVEIRLEADGRHTYDYEDTKSWVEAESVQLPGALDESFETLDAWTCENQPREGQHNDTPTVGTCEIRNGNAYVEEHTNRMRSLSTTVTVPESGDQTLTATIRGHISASWSNARLTVAVTEPTVERIQLDASEPLTIRRGQAEEAPSVLDMTPPPTAVERDEGPALSVRVDPGSVDPSDLATVATVFGSWRGDPLDVGDGRATTYTQVLDSTVTDDGTLVFDDTLPSASELPLTERFERGFEYETSVRVVDESVGETVAAFGDFRTYAFDAVDRVAAVAARASDTTPELGNGDLWSHLRSKVQYLNRYYASGLGSMGAKGFDVEFVNFTTENTGALDAGWLALPDGWNHYSQPDTDSDGEHIDEVPGDSTFDFVTDGLAAAANDLDVDFTQYDTALVTNGKDTTRQTPDGDDQWGLSRSVWRGEPMKEFTIPVLGVTVEPGEIAGMTPFETPSGSIDAIYAPMHVDTWLHEFGHSLGPDRQVGFPDLYDIPTPFQNFGVVNGWGLMGGRNGKVISAFCRTLGDDPYNYANGWLDADVTPHVLDDVEVDVDPLTEKVIGDAADWVVSAWANTSISVGLDGVSVDAKPKLGLYVVEGRAGGQAFQSPDGYQLWKTPGQDAESGVQLYRFNGLTVEGSVSGLEEFVQDILDREVPDAPEITISDADAISIEAMPPKSGSKTEHTLANETDTVTDPASATTFELVADGEDGTGTVNLHRDTGLLGDSYRFVADVLGGLQDLADEYTSGSHDQAPPPLDVMAVTADGRRVGVDPETGDVVNEVDGARVYQTPTSTYVSVPRSVDAEFSVSDHRLREALEDRTDLALPDELTYRRTIVDDGDLSVEDRDGVAFIDGRISYTTEATVSADETSAPPALQSVDADVAPERVNANADGRWVTAKVGLPDGASPDDLAIESVVLAGVPAVSDDQYGFVRNPPTSTRNGRTYVHAKVPRGELVDALGDGTHDPALFASLNEGSTFLRGNPTVEVFSPGNGGNGGAGDGNGDGGGGNGGNGGSSGGGSGGDGGGNGNGSGARIGTDR